jgi:multiple sugar transport system ATP-binding protein
VKGSQPGGVEVQLPGGGLVTIPVEPRNATPGAACTVGFRPETLTMTSEGPFGGTVAVVEHLGGETLVYVDVGNGHLVTVKTAGSTAARIGDRVRLSVATDEARLFDKDGVAMEPVQRRAIAGLATAAQ